MSDQGKEESLSTSGSGKRLTEIRIILTGGRELFGREESGKSSTGNIILGRNAFVVGKRTARSVKADAEVHGRHVTVVDTPGWWWHYDVEDTPKFDRMEIKRSSTLCPPGPHVFLLVIPVDSGFKTIYRTALQKQLESLSEKIWGYTIVLFSSTSPHDKATFKNSLRLCPDLLWLLKMCQNRYHFLNINSIDDSLQVTTLLEKIEEMVAKNNGNYLVSIPAEDLKKNTTEEKVKPKNLFRKKDRTELQAHIKKQHLTDIHIVILGASWDSKSSAGNLILGEDVFDVDESRTTVSCAVRQAQVHGRKLTVVDTPGWYCYNSLEKTSEMDKLEIRRSVYLCPPGPHVILLTIPIAIAFNKLYQIAVEEHMSLFGKKVWSHTIVLFTRGDWLGDTTIEERTEEEGKHLEWLMEQCGHRYHVFNCKQYTDSTQVTELLEKIEDMVMENNGCQYVPEIENNPSTELELKLKTGKTNMMKVSKKKQILHELLKENTFSDVRIVLLGLEGAGKSMSGNIILEGHFFEDKLAECVMQQKKVEGYQVSVVNTPNCSEFTLENAKEIFRSVKVCSPGPHAFLLVLPLRVSFTKKAQQTVEDIMNLFGENVWRHTVVVFSYGHWLKDRPAEEYIACEGEALQELVRKCGNRYHVLVNTWSSRSQVKDLLGVIEVMVARNRGEYFSLKKEESKPPTKTLTEDEWNKREDELIEKMLEAAIMDLDTEWNKPSAKRRNSIDRSINLSEDSLSDSNSAAGADNLLYNSAAKVCQWLRHPKHHAASSGHDTMSITSSYMGINEQGHQDLKMESDEKDAKDTVPET
ncbi:GTPase IMAP family member 8-like isoform X1 [Carassius carassius]|uniref:GTPase IMAP family member 8-like isoform X1 n=1 Tax=Carassius carassius TaxID=217509 RepID=UPI0028689AB9|nr:GTPase IMAP family member 8-like isoform X1 [Carassius carassius]XP_059361608.1 GTPase IMAP family member 8-like isoform X1 [Carassius carassius]